MTQDRLALETDDERSCEWCEEETGVWFASCGGVFRGDAAVDDCHQPLTVCPRCKGRVIEAWMMSSTEDDDDE